MEIPTGVDILKEEENSKIQFIVDVIIGQFFKNVNKEDLIEQ